MEGALNLSRGPVGSSLLTPVLRGLIRSDPLEDFLLSFCVLGKLDVTSPKFNIAPENRPSQKETYLPTIHFQGLC